MIQKIVISFVIGFLMCCYTAYADTHFYVNITPGHVIEREVHVYDGFYNRSYVRYNRHYNNYRVCNRVCGCSCGCNSCYNNCRCFRGCCRCYRKSLNAIRRENRVHHEVWYHGGRW